MTEKDNNALKDWIRKIDANYNNIYKRLEQKFDNRAKEMQIRRTKIYSLSSLVLKKEQGKIIHA